MGRKFTIFALFYFVFEGKFQVQAPWGAYIRRGDLTEGFLRYDFGGLIFRGVIHGGAYFWNFTVAFPVGTKSIRYCVNTSSLDSGRKWNFSCTEPKAKEQTAWAKSIQFSFISPRYIFGDPGAVIRVGRNRRDESIPFMATRLTTPGSTKIRRCPRYWLVRQMCSLTFHTCVKWSRDPNSAFLICNYLCSVEFQRSHLKALFTRIRTVLKPCILLPGFMWTGLNKPLDLESGCKKVVFGEQIQRAYLWKKKIAVSKMSGFVWTGNNSIPEYFSISISIFNILRHQNRLLIRFQ